MRIAVDRNTVCQAIPGADRFLEIPDIVVHVDLLLDPIWHHRGQTLPAHVAFERRAHLENVEINSPSGDRLLQPWVVVSLGEVDPVDRGAGVLYPCGQQRAENEIVQVLVVETHKRQLDAIELARLNIGTRRLEAELADLLHIGVGRLPGSNSRNLQDLRADIVLRECALIRLASYA
ncbi:hypothetical protein BH24CHL4_BH24CHL4_22190 [soil metagenome]